MPARMTTNRRQSHSEDPEEEAFYKIENAHPPTPPPKKKKDAKKSSPNHSLLQRSRTTGIFGDRDRHSGMGMLHASKPGSGFRGSGFRVQSV